MAADAPQRSPRAPRESIFTNHLLVGSIILLVGLVGVVLSYSANRGLPFVPTYEVRAEVPDAAELVEGSSEVRIGGSRVGIVKEVDAQPASGDRRAYALLTLALDVEQAGLPVDSTVQVRPRSILGAKFVDLTRGTSAREVPRGGRLPISQAIAGVQLDEAFEVFEPRTRAAVRRAIVNVGDALAGRGSALNATIGEVAGLLPPLARVLRTVNAPATGLAEALQAADGASAALAPVARELRGIVRDGATTMAAIEAAGPELERAIAAGPATFDAGRAAGLASAPVLADATAVAAALRPGARALRPAAAALTRSLRRATPVLGRVPTLTTRLDVALRDLTTLATQPASRPAVKRLTDTVTSARTTLGTLLPAQRTCNVAGLFVRGISGALSEGDAVAPWLTFVPVASTTQTFQAATTAPDLHTNPLPNNDARECETGNEPFLPGQQVGNPAGLQRAATDETRPPATATRRARAAGLLEDVAR